MPGRADKPRTETRPARSGDRSPRGRFHGALNDHCPELKASSAKPLRHLYYGLLAGVKQPVEMSGATDEQWTALRGELEYHKRSCSGDGCALLAAAETLLTEARRVAA